MAHVEFDVALSFAGEDRHIAEQLFTTLTNRGFTVFYDRAYEAEGWGHDLPEVLGRTYDGRARYCLMLVSQHYVAKGYPLLEKRHAQAHHLRNPDGDYILQVRLDGTPAPGLPDTMWWVPFRSVDNVVDLVERKLGSPSRVVDAVDALVAAIRTRSADAIDVIVTQTIGPLEGFASLPGSVARNVRKITDACAEAECQNHGVVASFLCRYPAIALPLMRAYPDLTECESEVLRNFSDPEVNEFFREITRKGATAPYFNVAFGHVQARLWGNAEPAEQDEAAVVEAYQRSPQVGYVMLELLARCTPKTIKALQDQVENGPEANRALILMFAHSKYYDLFLPVLHRMLLNGRTEGMVLGYLAKAGLDAAIAKQREIERDLRIAFHSEDADVVDALVFLRTWGDNVVRDHRDRLRQESYSHRIGADGEQHAAKRLRVFDEAMVKAVQLDPTLSPAWSRVLDFLAESRAA